MYHLLRTALLCLLVLYFQVSHAQQVTSVWKGKINKTRVEVKIIQRGDLLTGTSYYYESPRAYRRYSIQGYFDPEDNSVVWWDDQLIEEKGNFLFGKSQTALLSKADFNCPGPGKMYLTGKSSEVDDQTIDKGTVELTNVTEPVFEDEWDYVIENFRVGANDPYIIDSVALIAFQPVKPPARERDEVIVAAKPPKPGMVSIPFPEEKKEPLPQPKNEIGTPQVPVPVAPVTIEEKFTTRKKVVSREITVEGEFIELRFYDNAKVDGDSISLFLDDKLLFRHVRLTEKAHIIRIPVSELAETSELTMVAENLGSIPPNTAYMVAICSDKRYEAKLSSTENSSAVIRLKKPAKK